MDTEGENSNPLHKIAVSKTLEVRMEKITKNQKLQESFLPISPVL